MHRQQADFPIPGLFQSASTGLSSPQSQFPQRTAGLAQSKTIGDWAMFTAAIDLSLERRTSDEEKARVNLGVNQNSGSGF